MPVTGIQIKSLGTGYTGMDNNMLACFGWF